MGIIQTLLSPKINLTLDLVSFIVAGSSSMQRPDPGTLS